MQCTSSNSTQQRAVIAYTLASPLHNGSHFVNCTINVSFTFKRIVNLRPLISIFCPQRRNIIYYLCKLTIDLLSFRPSLHLKLLFPFPSTYFSPTDVYTQCDTGVRL